MLWNTIMNGVRPPNPVVAKRRHASLRVDVKMLFGIFTWTPTLPSTSCVMATLAAMLAS